MQAFSWELGDGMAVVAGTAAADFIHRAGDGFVAGGFEINTVTTGDDNISGAAGNDIIFADAGNDTASGDEGNDTIVGGQGTDRTAGGTGNDVFRYVGVSEISGLAETVNGGADIDMMDFATFNAFGALDLSLASISSIEHLFLQGNDVTLTSDQLGAFSIVTGGGFVERLILTDTGVVDLSGATISNINELRGNAMANTVLLTGVAAGQTVELLAGDDSADGSDGGDLIGGGDGLDTLRGRDGNDSLGGGDGADLLDGGKGNDTLDGGDGIDNQSGGAGNDVFRIDLTSDVSGLAESISGGSGLDALDFRTGLAGGQADITLAVLSSLETLLLGNTELVIRANQLSGFDSIEGSGFAERILLSGNGTADLTGATINFVDEIRGSTGNNAILLTDVLAGQFVDARDGNDSVAGGLGSDRIVGGFGNDTLSGSEGFDTITGGQGIDLVQGGIGNDTILISGVSDVSGLAETIDGGADSDLLDFQTLGASGIADLSTSTLIGIENLRLSANTLTFTAAQLEAFETIQGSGFTEILRLATAGIVDLSGGSISFVEAIEGTAGNDTILFTGGTGNQSFFGGAGTDVIASGLGNDLLAGGDGNDTLDGSNGNDTVIGGIGTDQMTGGFGTDRFDFNDFSELSKGAPRDIITDFSHGEDVVDLADLDANSEVAGNQAFIFIGGASFGNVAGELRYNGGVLSMDVNGDGTADFQIGLNGTPEVTPGDLVL